MVGGRATSSQLLAQVLYGAHALLQPVPVWVVAFATPCVPDCDAALETIAEFRAKHGEAVTSLVPAGMWRPGEHVCEQFPSLLLISVSPAARSRNVPEAARRLRGGCSAGRMRPAAQRRLARGARAVASRGRRTARRDGRAESGARKGAGSRPGAPHARRPVAMARRSERRGERTRARSGRARRRRQGASVAVRAAACSGAIRRDCAAARER